MWQHSLRTNVLQIMKGAQFVIRACTWITNRMFAVGLQQLCSNFVEHILQSNTNANFVTIQSKDFNTLTVIQALQMMIEIIRKTEYFIDCVVQ